SARAGRGLVQRVPRCKIGPPSGVASAEQGGTAPQNIFLIGLGDPAGLPGPHGVASILIRDRWTRGAPARHGTASSSPDAWRSSTSRLPAASAIRTLCGHERLERAILVRRQ